jgi:hypothetical protein
MSVDIDDLLLMRLADGELPAAEAAALLARIEADPALAARYALFRRTRNAVAAAFAPVAEQPVPPRLLAAIAAAARPAAAAPVASRPAGWRRRPQAWLALAASLAGLVALPVGFLFGWLAAAPDMAARDFDPLMAARPLLLAALDAAPSGERSADGRTVRVLSTHPVPDGICRDFTMRGDGRRVLGVACHEDGGWRVRAALTLRNSAEGFVPATAEDPLLRDMLERLGAAPPLDEAAERAWQARGWRPAR